MGPPDRITFGFVNGFGLMLTFDRFPYALTITMTLGCFWCMVGIGPDYVSDSGGDRHD